MATEPANATGATTDGPPRKRLRSSKIFIDQGDFYAVQQIFQLRLGLPTLLEPRRDFPPLVEIGDESTGNRVTKLCLCGYDFTEDEYQQLTSHIVALDALEVLQLDSKLSKVCSDAEWLGKMTQLKDFTWEYDRENISHPPRVIERLPQLEKLKISVRSYGFHLSFEEENLGFIFDLKNLKELDLDLVDGLPDKIENTNTLKILKLQYIRTTVLPSVIWNLTNLEYLLVSGNVIIPDDIERLTSLKELNVSGVSQVSSSIGNLPNLKTLHLGHSIKSLSSTMSARPSNDVQRFQSLESVNIYTGGYDISGYSEEIAILHAMPNLRFLRFHNKSYCHDEKSYRILLNLAHHCPFLGCLDGLELWFETLELDLNRDILLKKLRENRTRWVSRQLEILVGPRDVPVALWPLFLARAGRVLSASYDKQAGDNMSDTWASQKQQMKGVSESDVVFRLLTQKAANDVFRSE